MFSIRGLEQKVLQPTRVPPPDQSGQVKLGHIIDWVVVRNTQLFFDFQVYDKHISDHSVVTFNTRFQNLSNSKRAIKSRNVRAIDPTCFTTDMRSCNSTICSATDNLQFTILNLLVSLIDMRHYVHGMLHPANQHLG